MNSRAAAFRQELVSDKFATHIGETNVRNSIVFIYPKSFGWEGEMNTQLFWILVVVLGGVRIPAISATDSGLNRPPIPFHFGHLFRAKTATPSGGLRGLTISSSW